MEMDFALAEGEECSILSETIHNILKMCGHDSDIALHTAVGMTRFHSKASHKCDLCIPIIGGELSEAYIPLPLNSERIGSSRIHVNLKKLQENLPHFSKSWALPLKSCCYSQHSLCLYVDREKALRSTLPRIIEKGADYGWFPRNGKKISLTKDPVPDKEAMNLVQLRMELASQSLSNILERIGYSVMNNTDSGIENQNLFPLHLSNKSTCNSKPPKSLLILCGAVQTSIDGIIKKDISASDYYRKKEEKLRLIEKNRQINEEHNIQVQTLSKAEAIAELLFVKLHDNVSIALDESLKSVSDKRGASFLLYNHVRLLAIRRKFEDLCKNQIYPKLPLIHDVNFGLLKQEEEWEIFLLLLRFPFWLSSCVGNVKQGKVSLHPLLIGLDRLSRVFSVYYRRVRILTEPRSHLLPVMFARLYLLQSVENVLKNGLSILGMDTLDYM